MKIIDPKPEICLLPEDAELVTYAKDQPQYRPLPSIKTKDGKVVSMWELTENEKELLKNGAPVTLVVHTFNHPLQPVLLVVGGVDLRD